MLTIAVSLPACHQQLFALRCLPAGTEKGGAQQEGVAKISDMKGSNTASAKLTQLQDCLQQSTSLAMQQALEDCNASTLPHVWKKHKPPYSCSQGWLMYLDMSMLEWVDQTQMSPEAGVVDAAQTD